MMKPWRKRAASCVLVLMVLGSGLSVLAAVQGTQENPLVSLSYLKSVFKPEILQETDKKLADTKATYEKKLTDKVTAYTQEMQSLSGGGTGSGAAFVVVDLAAGKSLKGGVGCEVMLRSGAAQCVGTANPALVDSTSGGTLEGGAALEKNHLYLVSGEGSSVKAQNATKLLVRGSYTLP